MALDAMVPSHSLYGIRPRGETSCSLLQVHVRKAEDSGTVPFKYLVWLCYKTQLPRDLLFS